MQHVILGLLILHGPLSLYAVQRHFQQGVSLFYSASFGSITRALTQLAAQGSVTVAAASADARGRKPYTVTDAGRASWRAWMLSPVTGADVETTALARVFFLGLLPDADRPAAVASIRARIEADLAELEDVARSLDGAEIPAEFAEVFAFQRATLDYGIRSNRLALAWCDELPARARG
ncbi:PadR family transcriptional regulator [Microbacterium sp. M3]|uniref:PadR family transcriptional regulator n=1 Tax=Microbacterium arthrosphaerae TaxID=792652 RepID=A0ABU4GWB9_9MICO|nr:MULTISPECIES: PadR family transcriptional regulator [Microbacterium]MDW4571356.1 PadR family transcriptional regulator [Microbacterium arthrosphaerae]MDW7605211.1 PadR family transcriptional regulator [Microbacterium sp. M3]